MEDANQTLAQTILQKVQTKNHLQIELYMVKCQLEHTYFRFAATLT